MVVNYNNGKIYKIINENCETVYIGSTTQVLCQRYTRHHHKAQNHKIILIENYSCNSKEELCKREQEVIDKNSNLFNKCRAFGLDESRKKQTKKEWCKNNKEKIIEKQKEWYENNKEKIQEYKKEYRENNKEKIKQREKEYYEKNKENYKEQFKEYYEKNKEKIQEYKNKKIKCEFCNKEISNSNLSKHQKSKKCIAVQNKDLV